MKNATGNWSKKHRVQFGWMSFCLFPGEVRMQTNWEGHNGRIKLWHLRGGWMAVNHIITTAERSAWCHIQWSDRPVVSIHGFNQHWFQFSRFSAIYRSSTNAGTLRHLRLISGLCRIGTLALSHSVKTSSSYVPREFQRRTLVVTRSSILCSFHPATACWNAGMENAGEDSRLQGWKKQEYLQCKAEV